jgi:hypothetical protein
MKGRILEVVGAKGFEPSTSWSRTRRASQAALRPDNLRQHAKASPQGILEYHSNLASATAVCLTKQANAAALDSSTTAFLVKP